jgi:hypothetical protein
VRALVVLCLLAGTARAERPYVRCALGEQLADLPYETLLGWRIQGGTLEIRDRELSVAGLAVMAERRVHGRWRLFGEYEYAWLAEADDMDQHYEGSGHRGWAGVRVTLLESKRYIDKVLRFYVDGEVGGGVLLAHETRLGRFADPFGFIGLRVGYDFQNLHKGTTASSTWQPDILVRAIRTDDATGFVFGIGMGWGN